MAGAAVDCASDGAMDRTDLFLPGHNGERRPERGQPLVYSHPDRAWFVAGAGAHRAGTGAAGNVWLAVMIPFTLWLAVIWAAAINGVFRAGISPIRIPLSPLAIFL